MATQNDICFFNKYGFCKFLERCRRYHEDKSCENSECEIRECQLRHPKVCKYFRDFGFCKFSEWCKFSHKVSNETEKTNNEKKLGEKIKTIEINIQQRNEKIVKLENEIRDMHLLFSEQKQTMSKLNKKLNALKEKEKILLDLEIKFDILEKKVDKTNNIEAQEEIEIVKDNASIEASSEPSDDLTCKVRDFKAKNKFGLKIHFYKKHSSAKFKCFTCDFTCENYSELDEHNNKYHYSHRVTLNKYHEKYILDEFQKLDQDGFLIHRNLDW